MVKRKLTVGGLISHLASVEHYHNFKQKLFFMNDFPHAISLWNMIPGSLLPLLRTDRKVAPRSYSRFAFAFLTKRCNVVLSYRITHVRLPLA